VKIIDEIKKASKRFRQIKEIDFAGRSVTVKVEPMTRLVLPGNTSHISRF
jgi:hypothetical protein